MLGESKRQSEILGEKNKKNTQSTNRRNELELTPGDERGKQQARSDYTHARTA
jgi:hypothetical protein